MPYPDVSKVQTVPIDTVFAGCLRDVCCDGDDERDGHVLEYKEPGPLITAGEPLTHGASETRAGTYTIPSQATATALRLLQAIEEALPHLRIRYRICDQQKKIARESNGFVSVRPCLQIDC